MKYLPPASRPRRDSVATAYRPDSTVEELLTTRSWRALAALSRDRIVQSAGEVEDVEEILKVRLSLSFFALLPSSLSS
jgi:hypothetical protein